MIFVIIAVIGSLLFALLRPYKRNWLNVLDSIILASLALAALWILYNIEIHRMWMELVGFIATLPLVYFVIYVVYRLFSWFRLCQKCHQKSRSICQSLQQRWQGHGQQEMCDEEQQIANPFEYQPLPQNRDKDEDDLEADTACACHWCTLQ